jgi:hypothetical protein
MTPKVDNIRDYIAAVGKRQRMEQILREGAQQFSGYARELFESGVIKTLRQLDKAISEYEGLKFYRSKALCASLTPRITHEFVVVAGASSFERCSPSLAYPQNDPWIYLHRNQSRVDKKTVDVMFSKSEVPSSLALPQLASVGAQ